MARLGAGDNAAEAHLGLGEVIVMERPGRSKNGHRGDGRRKARSYKDEGWGKGEEVKEKEKMSWSDVRKDRGWLPWFVPCLCDDSMHALNHIIY